MGRARRSRPPAAGSTVPRRSGTNRTRDSATGGHGAWHLARPGSVRLVPGDRSGRAGGAPNVRRRALRRFRVATRHGWDPWKTHRRAHGIQPRHGTTGTGSSGRRPAHDRNPIERRATQPPARVRRRSRADGRAAASRVCAGSRAGPRPRCSARGPLDGAWPRPYTLLSQVTTRGIRVT